MASAYVPVGGNITIVDDFSVIAKFPLPTGGGGASATNPARNFPNGCPMWNNGKYGVEPCLLSPSGSTVGTNPVVTGASTYTSGPAANSGFQAVFAGFAAEQRAFQQLNSFGASSAPGGVAVSYEDASKPFLSVFKDGIAIAPYYDGINSTVQAQREIGELVQLTPFKNEATAGFYNADGTLAKDTAYYLYMNSVQFSASGNNTVGESIGTLAERALVGDTKVKFQFKASILNQSGLN